MRNFKRNAVEKLMNLFKKIDRGNFSAKGTIDKSSNDFSVSMTKDKYISLGVIESRCNDIVDDIMKEVQNMINKSLNERMKKHISLRHPLKNKK